jgi:glutathione S-transferase
MSLPKLTYFDFDGGRGEAARLAFAIGGVSFVDDRVPFAAWGDRKPHTLRGAPWMNGTLRAFKDASHAN